MDKVSHGKKSHLHPSVLPQSHTEHPLAGRVGYMC